MADFTFPLPDVGEGLTEAEIVQWRVKPGDEIAVNQIVCEIETGKSLVELPSPFVGVVNGLLAQEGDTILWSGPGSQNYRDIGGVKIPYPAREQARQALHDAGWGKTS